MSANGLQGSSYPYVDDRTFLASLHTLVEKETARYMKNPARMPSCSELAMDNITSKIQKFVTEHSLPWVEMCCAATTDEPDPLLGYLCPDVTRFIKDAVEPEMMFLPNQLKESISDLLQSRQNAIRIKRTCDEQRKECRRQAVLTIVQEVLFGLKRNRSEEDEKEAAKWVERHKHVPLYEVSDLDSDEEKAAADDEDDDDDVLFVDQNEKGMQVTSHQTEIDPKEKMKTEITSTLTIGKSRVAEEAKRKGFVVPVKVEKAATPRIDKNKKITIAPMAPKKKAPKLLVPSSDDDELNNASTPPPTPLN